MALVARGTQPPSRSLVSYAGVGAEGRTVRLWYFGSWSLPLCFSLASCSPLDRA